MSLGHSSFLRVFGKTCAESITAANIISVFKVTGINPFNPNAIPEVAFVRGANDIEIPTAVASETITHHGGLNSNSISTKST